MTPVFPSGVEDSLVNALRSSDTRLSKAAWEGLRVMGESWPSVVCVHVDSLLLEDAVHLRKEAARLLGRRGACRAPRMGPGHVGLGRRRGRGAP